MKPFISLFILFISFLPGTLRAELVNATVIDLDGKTIKCQINVGHRFISNDFNPLSVSKKIKVVLPDGGKKKFTPTDIRRFILHSVDGSIWVFESHKVKGRTLFLEVVSKEGIPLYRHHYPHGYDGSPQYVFVVEGPDGSLQKVSLLNWRTKLAAIFPGSAYFEREKKYRDFKYAMLPQFIAGYSGSYVR